MWLFNQNVANSSETEDKLAKQNFCIVGKIPWKLS